MKKPHGILVVAFVAVAFVARAPIAHSACYSGDEWGVAVVDVVLYDPTGTGQFFADVPFWHAELALKRAISAWNQNGMADIRLRYWGWTTNPGDITLGQIVVYATDDCSNCSSYPACEHSWTNPFSGKMEFSQVVVTDGPNCPFDWTVYPQSSGDRDLQGTFVHELGHSLSLQHPEACEGNYFASMANWAGDVTPQLPPFSKATDRRYPSHWDIDALVGRYGWLQGTTGYRQAVLWHSGWEWGDPALSQTSITPMSTVSSGGPTGQGSVWYAFGDLWAGYSPQVKYQWLNNSGASSEAWLPNDYLAAVTYDAPAVAMGGTTIFVAHTAYEGYASKKYIRYCRSSNAGQSWACDYAKDNASNYIQTARDGLSAAYDPSTDRFLVGYLRDKSTGSNPDDICYPSQTSACDAMQVFTVKRDGTSPRNNEFGGGSWGIQSIDAPALACRNTSGDYNCLAAWATKNYDSCLYYGHGHVDANGDFVLMQTNTTTSCIVLEQSPSLAVAMDSQYPWVLALQQLGNRENNYLVSKTIVTYQKAADINAGWINKVEQNIGAAPYGVSASGFIFWYQPQSQWRDEIDVFYTLPAN